MSKAANIRYEENMTSIYFDSLLELMDYEPECKANVSDFKRVIGIGEDPKHGAGWYGPTCQSAKESIEKALLGDEEMYENLAEKIKGLDKAVGKNTTSYTQHIKKAKRVIKRGNFGEEIDIHKIYQGQLDKAWRRTERVEVDQKHHLVTILIDVVASSNERAVDTLWRAAVAVKLCDDLVKAGKSVKVMCGSALHRATASGPNYLTSALVVKNYSEALSLPRLAAMTHTGFFRSAGFAMYHSQKHETLPHLGYPLNLKPSNMPVQLREEVEAGHTKFLPVGRISSLKGAIEGLEKAYAELDRLSKED